MGAKTEARPAATDHGSVVGVTLGELTSEELAWQAGRGCQASFAELVRRFAPKLQAFLRHRIGDRHEAEDIVQDTFLRAYENLERYDSSWRFSTWLFTIASRAAVSHHRRKHLPCVRSDVQAPACDEVAQKREQREGLWAMAAQLPEGQYRSLWLRYVEDMPIKEIARAMGKSQVCVKVLLYRARANLARYLESEEL
jgi:RNA polymerase sigma-70 factor, ECF subfamily